MSRTVRGGLERRQKVSPKNIDLDEIAFQKRYQYAGLAEKQKNMKINTLLPF